MDISADLTELGRTPVTVVSSGCKSFLDIPRTLEYLETEGVLVGTFADGRDGRVDFPAFWTRNSGIPSPAVIKDEKQAAAIVCKLFAIFITAPFTVLGRCKVFLPVHRSLISVKYHFPDHSWVYPSEKALVS